MKVLHAALTSMGYVVRDLGVDGDHARLGQSHHHGVNEVWSNELTKWVLVDAKYDIHFERNGAPLSALELHEAIRDGAQDVVKVQGPESQAAPIKSPDPCNSIQVYWWVSYPIRQDPFTRPDGSDSRPIVFDNAAFRRTVWHRSTKNGLEKHWAYAAKAFVPVSDRRKIEWTPGVPELRVRQETDCELEVGIKSTTPNLDGYRIRRDDHPWEIVKEGPVRWGIRKGLNTLEVHTYAQSVRRGRADSKSQYFSQVSTTVARRTFQLSGSSSERCDESGRSGSRGAPVGGR